MTESTQQVAPKPVLSLKEFLAKPKNERPKILLEHEVKLETESTVLTLVVRQLTKAQYEMFNKRIQGDSPAVPSVDTLYTQAHRDPSNPQKIRPAGTYKERDEQDPTYLKEVQEWFTSSCIMLAVFSSAESLGIRSDDMDALNESYLNLSFEIPGPALLEFALGAASVNPGIAIAEELQKQEMLRQQQLLAEIQLAHAEQQAREEEEAEERAIYEAAERRMTGDAPADPPPVLDPSSDQETLPPSPSDEN